jgi:exopolysaccharide biosynthesis protein
MKAIHLFCLSIFISAESSAQVKWQLVDSLFKPLPASVHVYKSTSEIEGKPSIAYFFVADLKDKNLLFSTDTTFGRRLTPTDFYERNAQPLVVVNTTFFSFETNQNLNTVIRNGRIVSHNKPVPGRGKDTLLFHHTLNSVFGISKKRKADIAWVFTDSFDRKAFASQVSIKNLKSSKHHLNKRQYLSITGDSILQGEQPKLKRWKMHTAVGGGPVLIQNGEKLITNNEERKFGGNAINDRHPRTALGYTSDGKLIILVVQGRFPGEAEGASLIHLADMLKEIGCVEAMNLDGGGSSCLLINGKETITPSDKKQRAIPAVLTIHTKK